MRSWSIPAGRLFGVDIRIHLTFLFLLAFVWFTQSVTMGVGGAARGVVLVGIIFACVVLHELGHALVAQRSGVLVRSIILLPIGGVTLMDDAAQQRDPARDIRISVAGPLVNLGIAAISGAFILAFMPQVKLWASPFVHAGNLPRAVFWGNVFLGGFNLLPAYPMDGGRILRAFLAERMEYVRATRLAVTVGQAFAMLFIFLGVWNTWLMLIGFFLFVGAQLEDRSVVFQSVLESVRMEDVMLTGFSTLSPADTLEDALQKAVHTLQDDFPVVRGSDMVGVISKAAHCGGAAPQRQRLCAIGDGARLRHRAAHRFAGVRFSQARQPRTEHDPRSRSAATGGNCLHAEPDAQHGAARRDAAIAAAAGERAIKFRVSSFKRERVGSPEPM